jgi:DNA topoisomerase I
MNLIISEKAIAGKRIATILSNNNLKTENISGVNCFKFTKDNEDYLVIPLRGHINSVDFSGQNKYWSIFGLDTLVAEKLIYKPVETKIIAQLKKERKDLKKVIIATDADREGEAIGVEAHDYIYKKNPGFILKRAYFSALTKSEVENAFNKLKELDFNFAYSVFARQEIDLLWGAVLTRYLSVISNRKGKRFLSAGRVQTPLLNFIVKRELERKAFVSEPFNILKIIFEKNKTKFEGTHKLGKIFDLENAKKIFENIKNQKQGVVKSISKTKKIIKKPDPFNTTSFLRAASNIGISTNQAMNLAESLYQQGLISYPRTDNTVYPNSLDFKEILNKLSLDKNYNKFTKEILSKPLHASRGKKETTDHPPIHPVDYNANLNGPEEKIYDLISRRFLATLSIDAITENLSAVIEVNKEPFIVNGQIIIEAGWKKIYIFSKLNEVIIPELKKEDLVNIVEPIKEDKITTPPNHYTEGGLIKLMEEQNLGTKSTRPSIIKKIRDRGYIEGTKQIIAKDIAISVCSVLEKHCSLITKPKLTSQTEEEMEEIAAGKKDKKEVVNENRDYLKKIISILKEEKDKISEELRTAAKSDDIIGICQICKKPLLIRISRNNKQFIGCSGYPKCRNTFPLPQNRKVQKTDKICEYCNNPIIKVLNGRRSYEMCINPKCKSKEEYFKSLEEKKKNTENTTQNETEIKVKKEKAKTKKTKIKFKTKKEKQQ